VSVEKVQAILVTCDACGKSEYRDPEYADDYIPGFLFPAVDHHDMRVREVYACSAKCIRKAVVTAFNRKD
jgi:hypothetical protein